MGDAHVRRLRTEQVDELRLREVRDRQDALGPFHGVAVVAPAPLEDLGCEQLGMGLVLQVGDRRHRRQAGLGGLQHQQRAEPQVEVLGRQPGRVEGGELGGRQRPRREPVEGAGVVVGAEQHPLESRVELHHLGQQVAHVVLETADPAGAQRLEVDADAHQWFRPGRRARTPRRNR